MKIKIATKSIGKIMFFLLVLVVTFSLGALTNNYYSGLLQNVELLNPFVDTGKLIQKPLIAFSIKQLQNRIYQPTHLKLEKIISEEEQYTSFLFSYTTLGKKMTGQINIPNSLTANPDTENKVILMIRGYVPQEVYTTGVGTENAAAAFAHDGYITVAPDFFGFGESDLESDNTWVARFEKPITVVELLKSIEKNGIPLNLESERTSTTFDLDTAHVSNIGIWAHSNGGQIALTTLEILRRPIPTTLWAPVTTPFPYSILYFSDELADEGKEQRKWIAMFEQEYDAFDFSLTQHLDSLTGPIQIQHGTADDAALIFWSEEFVSKVEAENHQRAQISERLQKESTIPLLDNQDFATNSANTELDTANTTKKPENPNTNNQLQTPLPPIEIELITYQNTNHNMVPNWNRAIQKDLQFFRTHFSE